MFYFYKMNTLMIYLYCKMGCNSEKNLKISPFSTKNQETIEKYAARLQRYMKE